MITNHSIKASLRYLLLAGMLSVLAGCGGGSATTTGTTTTDVATNVALAGSVGDGPVTGATVSVYASDGSLLGTVVTDSSASFRSTVKARGRDYPLRLVVSGGTDLVTGLAPDFKMVSLLQHPSHKQANINPFTTLVVGLAELLPGGLSSSNVSAAQGIVQQRLGFGLDPALVPDPFTTQIDDSNVASLVKASEALGELVRRTRDLSGASADTVVRALAADLTDGFLDGLGAAGTSARLAAVANVAASQVLVETLSNSLRVGGVIASGVMDQSIVSTRPGIAGSQLTGGVLITDQLLGQARVAVGAARVLDGGAAVQDIASRVDGLSAGSTAADTSGVLSADSTNTLANAVNLVSVASDSQLQEVNVAVSTGTVSTPVNTAPVISGVPEVAVMATSNYVFKPTATDADGNKLTFSIINQPEWATFDTGDGTLSGAPATAYVGTHGNIIISVSDGTDKVSLAAFAIEVEPLPVVNTAPVIFGVPAGSVTATGSYLFKPTATDADRDVLAFSIANKPVWATFNTGNGTLSGVPSTANVGTYNNIIISVDDGTDKVSLAAFGIQVNPVPVVNTAPVISGSPATAVTANSAYLFKPTATDADDNKLTFSIINQPAWAAFDLSTGELSGTPLNADADTYPNIVISVTDGVDTASLGPFSIEVSAATGKFTLSWTAPVARADGSPLSLSDIDGYRIHYRNSQGKYTVVADVADGTATSATISNLPVGNYYVVMSTYDTGGLESSLSGEVPKTAQ